MEKNRSLKAMPFNPVSPVVIGLVAIMLGVELVFQAGEHNLIGGPMAEGWRVDMLRFFGFHKAVFDHLLVGGEVEPKVIWPFLSYLFVFRSFAHMLIATALILAMGKMIADVFSSLAVLVLFVTCGLAGSISFGLFSPDGGFPLAGAYPVFYGFIGTYTWIRLFELRAQKVSVIPAFYPIGLFVIMRGGFAMMYGVSNSWMADLSGLIAGFLLAFILAPDGRDRLNSWVKTIRNR